MSTTTPTPLVAAGTRERREVGLSEIELREEDDKLIFVGHASVFDRLSEDLGGFRERIQRGAFRKVLDANPDVRFLFNHDANHVMARTKAGTMELREDPKGLRVYAELAPTTMAKDLRILVKRGDVDGMSFAFSVDKDVWADEDGELTRTIVSFRELFDVGPVVYPAYQQTDASMRALVCGLEVVNELGEVQESVLRDLAWRIHRGELVATEQERDVIDVAYKRTTTVSPWAVERAARAVFQEPELQAAIQGKRITIRMDDRPSGEAVAFRLAARKRRLRAMTV